jgi:hypothetical protein
MLLAKMATMIPRLARRCQTADPLRDDPVADQNLIKVIVDTLKKQLA